MSTEDESSLAIDAKTELEMCCQTLCIKQPITDYIIHLENKILELTNTIKEYENVRKKS